jgi:hypothetical protein
LVAPAFSSVAPPALFLRLPRVTSFLQFIYPPLTIAFAGRGKVSNMKLTHIISIIWVIAMAGLKSCGKIGQTA